MLPGTLVPWVFGALGLLAVGVIEVSNIEVSNIEVSNIGNWEFSRRENVHSNGIPPIRPVVTPRSSCSVPLPTEITSRPATKRLPSNRCFGRHNPAW